MGRTSDANERLMKAALALMWEQSYGAVSIDDICRRANVKKGSFYYFFHSKSDLAVQALETYWEADKRVLDEIFSSATPPLQRIRDFCTHTYRLQCQSRVESGSVLGCPLCCLGSEVSTLDADIRDKVREILARKTRYWESALRDAQAEGRMPAGDAASQARCAMAYLQGLVAQARLNDDAEGLRRLPEMMFEHLGIREPASTAA